MPKLSELTDAYTPQETLDSLPVESPFTSVPVDADGVRRVRIDAVAPQPEGSPYSNLDTAIGPSFGEGVTEHPLVKQLFGLGGETRYQLWPERMVREGLSAAGDVMSGKVPQWAVDPETGDVHTSPNMVEKAQEMSALAGTGGLAGMTTDATLGATPFLRPALKYKDKLYKGKDGQQHLDVIPESIYPEFQKKAMSGEDINEFKFGFVNDKGHFLDRETALKYGIDTGLVDPAAGKFGALTSTLMADSSKPGVAIEAMKTANPFFSAVEHNVNAIPQAKMTGGQWLGTLSNKPGVKPEEMAWTGLQDFLMENKGKPVTKEQIVEHLQNNKVELKEVGKGEEFNNTRKAKAQELMAKLNELEKDNIAKGTFKNTPEMDKIQSELQAVREQSQAVATKYHGYQLPGGENYREMLLTLPETSPVVKQMQANQKRLHEINKEMDGNSTPELRSEYDAIKAQQNELRSKIPDTYKSSHWDEPNILAHVRMNDRTIDGKKSLHLEEIQSDWHQQGRDKGYKGNRKALTDKELNRFHELQKKLDTATPQEKTEFNDLMIRSGEDLRQGLVPDAPFKKSWHELALKRMLREAAEKGYDRLSWTPGEAQAARYDLSRQVKQVKAGRMDGGWALEMKDNNGRDLYHTAHNDSELSNFVGKELAHKILEDAKSRSFKDGDGQRVKLEGVDLKIGGEGMKGFYDQIIPKAIEKLGKEHGVKVKKGFVKGEHDASLNEPFESRDMAIDVLNRGGEIYAVGRHGQEELVRNVAELKHAENELGSFSEFILGDKQPQQPIHYIDIPQSLKDQAMHKGFPLFSAGGHMLIPVNHNPFENDEK